MGRPRRRVLARTLGHLQPHHQQPRTSSCAAAAQAPAAAANGAEAAPYPRVIDADPLLDPAAYPQLSDLPLEYTAFTHDAILSAMRTDGCVLLEGAVGGDELEHMRQDLLALPEDEGSPGNDGMRSVGSRNFEHMFNRHPRWLTLLTPPEPVPAVLSKMLAGHHGHDGEYRCISQKALRHAPGHNDWRVEPDEIELHVGGQPATPPTGWDANGFHVDQTFAPEGLSAELVQQHGIEPPCLIITAYQYINGTDRWRCPTRVVPGSWRLCREPHDEESEWAGTAPRVVLAKPGDLLLFRSDVWHSASVNLTADQARLVVETNFGAHKVAGGAYGGGNSYAHLPLAPATEDSITTAQLRILGQHRRRGR